jgi:dienelactone hydrolase
LTPERLAALLALPARPAKPPAAQTVRVETRDGMTVETIALDLGAERPVRGQLTRPAATLGRLPAVLYCHAHGSRYEIGASELFRGRAALLSPYGDVLARAGYVTLCIDMPTFGDRSGNNWSDRENPLSKALLWQGRTLMGVMLGELLAAFDWLAARSDVDPARIAAIGVSMGATHSFFLGALEPKIERIAQLCCFADIATLIETGAHDFHGHYMTIPGLLAETTFGEIAGMIAPRPQLITIGADDPLTPPLAVERAVAATKAAYERAGMPDALSVLIEPNSGHVETQAMRAAVLRLLAGM